MTDKFDAGEFGTANASAIETPTESELKAEFDQFMNNQSANDPWENERVSLRPPLSLFEKTRSQIHSRLNPPLPILFAKLAALHLIAGSASLSICSQFGFGNGHYVSHRLMKFGETACMLGCGSLFLGLTMIAATVILSRDELRKIRRTFYAAPSSLAILSLLFFWLAGARISMTIASAWLVGALFAATLSIELGLRLRRAVFSAQS